MTDPVIASLEARAYTIPTDAPEGDGTLTWDATTIVVVRAAAGDHVGTGWTYAPRAAVDVVEDLLAPTVVGGSGLAPRDAWQRQATAVRNAGRPGLVGMAMSAVDTALWDLCARLHDVSLSAMWGSDPSPVPVYGSGGFTTYDDDRLRAQLESWIAGGLTRVKIKIGESWGREERRDLRRTWLARDTVGDDVELFVDANGAYSPGQACRVGHALDQLGVTWFEEPVSSDDLSGLGRVRDRVAADVAAGEYGYDVAYFGTMATSGSVDCLQVDVTRCGGYTEWCRIAAVARSAGLPLSGHCAPYLSQPIAAVTPGLQHLEWFHDHVRIERSLFDGCVDPVAGHLPPHPGPGHGLTLRSTAEEFRSR